MDTNQSAQHPRPRAAARQPRAAAKGSATPEQEQLGVAVEQAVQSVGALYQQVQGTLQDKAENAPYLTLGAAAAVGFVIGGGLASPLGQRLIRLSFRQFGPPILQALLEATKPALEPDGPNADE